MKEFRVFCNVMLNVEFLNRVAREGNSKFGDDSFLKVRGHLVPVEVVLLCVSASKVNDKGTARFVVATKPSLVLNEGSERSKSGSHTSADNWSFLSVREMESRCLNCCTNGLSA